VARRWELEIIEPQTRSAWAKFPHALQNRAGSRTASFLGLQSAIRCRAITGSLQDGKDSNRSKPNVCVARGGALLRVAFGENVAVDVRFAVILRVEDHLPEATLNCTSTISFGLTHTAICSSSDPTSLSSASLATTKLSSGNIAKRFSRSWRGAAGVCWKVRVTTKRFDGSEAQEIV
jgi:hypothetical protein